MASGYEDLDNLVNQQNSLLQQQEQKQNEVINQQTQMQVDELNREKEKLDKETNKTTQGLSKTSKPIWCWNGTTCNARFRQFWICRNYKNIII